MENQKLSHQKKQQITDALKAVRETAERPCRVLVVESDPDMQWHLARLLTVQGNRVVGTSSGEGALALIGEWSVDLVLVDEELPGMGGLELSSRIQEDHPEIPVVVMSHRDDEDAREDALSAGAVALLTKPFQRDALEKLLLAVAPLVGVGVAE